MESMTIYVIDTADLTAGQLEIITAALPAERRASAARFLHQSDRAESAASAYMAYFALCAGLTDKGLINAGSDLILGRVNDVVRLGEQIGWVAGKYGKPFENGVSTDSKMLHISLSHSGGLVAAAVSSAPVGVDIQRIPDIPLQRMIRIAKRFHPDERAMLENTPEAQMAEQFCRLWACKESVLKLCGRGLSLPLSSFCIENDTCMLDGRQIVLTAEPLCGAYLAAAQWKR